MIRKTVSLKWAVSWLEIALLIFVSTILLCMPFVPVVWLLWNYVAVKLGLPSLSFVEMVALVLLLRLLQPSIMLTNPTAQKAADAATEERQAA
jgi:hypothetical protein